MPQQNQARHESQAFVIPAQAGIQGSMAVTLNQRYGQGFTTSEALTIPNSMLSAWVDSGFRHSPE